MLSKHRNTLLLGVAAAVLAGSILTLRYYDPVTMDSPSAHVVTSPAPATPNAPAAHRGLSREVEAVTAPHGTAQGVPAAPVRSSPEADSAERLAHALENLDAQADSETMLPLLSLLAAYGGDAGYNKLLELAWQHPDSEVRTAAVAALPAHEHTPDALRELLHSDTGGEVQAAALRRMFALEGDTDDPAGRLYQQDVDAVLTGTATEAPLLAAIEYADYYLPREEFITLAHELRERGTLSPEVYDELRERLLEYGPDAAERAGFEAERLAPDDTEPADVPPEPLDSG
jgi:hypothetical protein